jgi:hypothetical protein
MNGYGLFTHRLDNHWSLFLNHWSLFLNHWSLFLNHWSSLITDHAITDIVWAWDTEYGHKRIYLKDSALTQFIPMKTKLEARDENI